MGPHNALFAQIPARDLVKLMRTCRRVYLLVHDTCFSITRLLSPFFGDPSEVARFRETQAQTATVISGSTALQFFNRLTYPDSDLDLYAYRELAYLPVHFLLDNGYTYNPRESPDPDQPSRSQDPDVFVQLFEAAQRTISYLGRGIADVLDFRKGDKKIQLIIATSTPMEIILSFHATCVMNIITHDKAYALYPNSTFVAKTALIVETSGAGQEAGRQKYVDRGWTMVPTPSVSSTSELGVRAIRWVGDHFTWILPLSPPPEDTHQDFCPLNSWYLDCADDTTTTKWDLFEHPALEYSYVVSDLGAVSAIADKFAYLIAHVYGPD
ncbi:hypothetical protein B0H11DRAFT_1928451 [Mycena galericulata]|nr:hypothetical protein B0H11DRAFT_1928451 [Mycena galericulata]